MYSLNADGTVVTSHPVQMEVAIERGEAQCGLSSSLSALEGWAQVTREVSPRLC